MPSLKDLRYRIEYLALRLIAALVRLVPIDVGGSISAKAFPKRCSGGTPDRPPPPRSSYFFLPKMGELKNFGFTPLYSF